MPPNRDTIRYRESRLRLLETSRKKEKMKATNFTRRRRRKESYNGVKYFFTTQKRIGLLLLHFYQLI
jgi:guanylate kinase